MSERHAACSTCMYFSNQKTNDGRMYIVCRRYPPREDEWARVMWDDWCGEWRERDVPAWEREP